MKKSIVIIEDDLNVRENIFTLLFEEGYEVDKAVNGDEGIKLAREILPDLIVCDVMMVGKSGYDVLEELRKENSTKKIPFIFLTAKAERDDIRKGMQLGADDYILKPYRAADLLNSIKLRFEKIELLTNEKKEVPPSETGSITKPLSIDDKIFIHVNNKPQLVKISEIIAVTAENQYTTLICPCNKTLLVRKSISAWEENLPKDNFLRIHRSTIINLNFIQKMEKWYNSSLLVYIKDIKEPFVVSKRYSAKLRKNLF